MALEPAWIGVIGTGIGALLAGITAFGTAVVQSYNARGQREHDAAQAKANRDAEAAEANAQRAHEEGLRQRERQYDLLDSWRAGIAALESDDHTEVLRTPWYETLRPHLAEEVLRQLEKPRTSIVPPDSARGIKDLFTGEVDRIERDWGLRP